MDRDGARRAIEPATADRCDRCAAFRRAATGLLLAAILYLCYLYASLLWLVVLEQGAGIDIRSLPVLVTIGGTLKGILFIWLSTEVRHGRLLGWTIGILAFFGGGYVYACVIGFLFAPPFKPVLVMLLHAIILLVVLGLVAHAWNRRRTTDPESIDEGVP